MHVNSSSSYSPSYTTNYGAAEQAKSRAATKVTYKPSADQTSQASAAWQAKADTQLVQKVGLRLNIKA